MNTERAKELVSLPSEECSSTEDIQALLNGLFN